MRLSKHLSISFVRLSLFGGLCTAATGSSVCVGSSELSLSTPSLYSPPVEEENLSHDFSACDACGDDDACASS